MELNQPIFVLVRLSLYSSKIFPVKNYILVFSFLISFLSVGQTNFAFEFDASIPVKIGTDPIDNAWAGGINFGQFSDLDFDLDGDKDLIVFDRSCDRFVVFLKETTPTNHYQYRYLLPNELPADIRYRAAFVDYNGDGQNDIFSYGLGGLKVYRNVSLQNGYLSFVVAKEIVQTNAYNSIVNLYITSADIPAYDDIDGDGDIDVLTFFSSGDRLEYHKNLSQETYGNSDSLIFELKNECWGQFREDLNTNNIVLHSTDSPCGTGNIPNPERPANGESLPKHSGSTVLAIDLDGNGVKDLIMGDVSYPTLTALVNGGTTVNSNSEMVSADNTYPSNNTPANINLFPGPYYVDVDFDGKKDLIVSPNARTVSENQSSVWFYKNLGVNNHPNFNYISNNFLQSEMIDHGLGSIPVMVDQNGDGLKDLIVANFFRYKPVIDKESCLLAYRNTGTSTAPVYSYLSNNYLDFLSEGLGLRAIPTFGDLDGDGDQDMIVGRDDGTVLKFTNTAGPGNPLAYGAGVLMQNSSSVNISVTAYSAPQLFDINKDGLLDLLIGNKSGSIAYYKNIGTSTSPSFHLEDATLGNVQLVANPDGYAMPHFFSVNDTTHLFLGANDGFLHYYNLIDGHMDPDSSFHLVSDSYLNIDVGLYSSFWVEDVDNDGALDLFVGQDLGGLHHYEANLSSSAGLKEKIQNQLMVYPNPGNGIFMIIGSADQSVDYEVYDLNERLVRKNTGTQIDLTTEQKGCYLLKVLVGDRVEVHRIIKN